MRFQDESTIKRRKEKKRKEKKKKETVPREKCTCIFTGSSHCGKNGKERKGKEGGKVISDESSRWFFFFWFFFLFFFFSRLQ